VILEAYGGFIIEKIMLMSVCWLICINVQCRIYICMSTNHLN